MAEEALAQLLENQQAPEQEIVETWPGYNPEDREGLSSLLGGAKEKVGDIFQRINYKVL